MFRLQAQKTRSVLGRKRVGPELKRSVLKSLGNFFNQRQGDMRLTKTRFYDKNKHRETKS